MMNAIIERRLRATPVLCAQRQRNGTCLALHMASSVFATLTPQGTPQALDSDTDLDEAQRLWLSLVV